MYHVSTFLHISYNEFMDLDSMVLMDLIPLDHYSNIFLIYTLLSNSYPFESAVSSSKYPIATLYFRCSHAVSPNVPKCRKVSAQKTKKLAKNRKKGLTIHILFAIIYEQRRESEKPSRREMAE